MSDASHGLLMNLETRQYDTEMFHNVGVDLDKFPQIHTSCEIAGRLSEEAAGLPRSAGAGFRVRRRRRRGLRQCRRRRGKAGRFLSQPRNHRMDRRSDGRAVHRPSTAYSIFTRSTATAATSSAPSSAPDALSHGPWICSRSPPRVRLIPAAATAPAGAGGLIYLPYLGRALSRLRRAGAGRFLRYEHHAQAGHFLRAVLEGTACGLSQILDVMREKQQIEELRIIGGGGQVEALEADPCRCVQCDAPRCIDVLRQRHEPRRGSRSRRRHRPVRESARGVQPHPHERRH